MAKASAQDPLDVGLRHGSLGVVIRAGPRGAAGAGPAAHERAVADEGRLSGQRVAGVTRSIRENCTLS